MAEELQSKYLKKGKIVGQKFGEFEYFQIGSTTFNQLKKAKLIPVGFSKEYDSKKPDRIIIDRNNPANPLVIAVIEDKKSGKFNSEIEKKKAIEQCNNYCQELNAKIGIITDGQITIWINPEEQNENTIYVDDKGIERSYSFIKREDGAEIIRNFIIDSKEDILTFDNVSDDTNNLYKLIIEIKNKINNSNSIIKQPGRIDPLPLARRVWQNIWVATGKTPEKCLYNVVELFIFKFLSDLKILSNPNDFDTLYKLVLNDKNAEDILIYYVKNCRYQIQTQFPKGTDSTTIINGTIFVDEKGDANITQASLFKNTLIEFYNFEKQFGKFSTHNIDKDFKTKLYETFLKQTAGLKALGQFFTPRKVIRAIVEISGIKDFKNGQRFCDPFCGVGGFVLEPLNLPERKNDFKPVNGKINSPIFYQGYDKGFEKDEERTIILAKANMLIYLAELVAENKNTIEFSNSAFNKTFKLLRSNLGTFAEITNNEDERFDLIMTNPPYVKGGTKTLKQDIASNSNLKNFYKINASGLEGLGIEWIVRHLKKEGKAFIIVPDGSLNSIGYKNLRKFICKECFVEGIISLPKKTFYTTQKKTYILAITKKKNNDEIQDFPVFTYLVSDIGEKLDTTRFETPEKNNLPEMVDLFNEFQIYKKKNKVFELQNKSKRCKIQPFQSFEKEEHWCIDRWWSMSERVELGIENESKILSLKDYYSALKNMQESYNKIINKFKKQIETEIDSSVKFKKVKLKKIFDFSKNTNSSSFTKAFIDQNKGDIPVYSASDNPDFVNYGFVKDNLPNIKYFENCMTWNIDGSVGKVFIRSGRFSLSEKVIPLILLPEVTHNINSLFLKFVIEKEAKKQEFDFNNKAGKSRLKEIEISIPVNENNEYDLATQKKIANKYKQISDLQRELSDKFNQISDYELYFD